MLLFFKFLLIFLLLRFGYKLLILNYYLRYSLLILFVNTQIFIKKEEDF